MKNGLLTIKDLSSILNLNPVSLNKKAKRQQWAFYADNKNPGSPIHIYPLDRLPDDVQIAWAQWDEERFNKARIAEELKGSAGRGRKIPPPVSEDLARQALTMPIRESWVKVFPDGQKPRKGGKIYDGHSKGICLDARKILISRFSESSDIEPDQIQDVTKDFQTPYQSKNSQKERPPIQPNLPPKEEWGGRVWEIEAPSKICPECDFGIFTQGHEEFKWCPYCIDKVELIEYCPNCSEQIMTPFYNGCPICGIRLRSKMSVLPPK